jgi:cytochrome c-type biogenesis protein CcmF
MFADLGYGVLVITFALAIYSIAAALCGHLLKSQKWVESARLAMLLIFPGVTLGVLSLIFLLVTDQYNVSFVYEVTGRSMPLYLKITALWGGQAGSILFWGWLMAAFAFAATLRNWDRDREFLPWVIVVTNATLAFFIGLVIFYENPFAKYWQTMSGEVVSAMFQPADTVLFTPDDGRGLNPLLRHPGMIIHPPMLYLGFVSFVIPFAFAFASLVTGRSDDRWIRITRRWTIVAWLFLTCGLVLGSRWAYDVLGWGGYWGWDPVEIAAFMPWLTGTAFLHSVMIQEKRGMLKHWNMLLIILTYDLVIFGTFLTRSGVLSSVHAFAQSAIGPAFFIFIGLTFAISIWLLIHRWADLSSETQMASLLSREALFLLNNLLFISILVVCFWGVVVPLLSEASGIIGQTIPALADTFTGQKLTVGPPFYERTTGPLFLALVLLMGIAPLSAWGYKTIRSLAKSRWTALATAALVLVVLFLLGLRDWIMLGVFGLAIVTFVVAVVEFRRIAWPSIVLAILVPAVLFLFGVRQWQALLGFGAGTFAGAATLYEYWRAIAARARAQQENIFLALWRLVGRNRRRYGGYLIHISVVMMAAGVIGIGVFQTQTQRSLAVGQSIELAGYTVRYDSLAQFPHEDGRMVTRAVMSVFKDGQFVEELHPRVDTYASGETMTIPGLHTSLGDDLYVVLVNWEGVTSQVAPFKIYHNPLINWLWIGSLFLIFGSVVAAWPDQEPEYVPTRVQRTQQVVYQPGD